MIAIARRLVLIAALALAPGVGLAQGYVDSPALAADVAAGKLPPIAQRLPQTLWVVGLSYLFGILLAVPNLFYERVEAHNDAALAATKAGFTTTEQQAAMDEWPSWLPSGLVNLGLDLRGGAHLLAEVQVGSNDAVAASRGASAP